MRGSQKSKTIRWMMESSRGLIPEIFGVQQQLTNPRYSSVAGCSNPSSTASCAATARRASYGTSTGEIHPMLAKLHPGHPSNTKTLKLVFFRVIFYGNLPWWSVIKSPLGSIFLEHVPSILSRSQVNESLEEEFPLQIDREFWCPCCLVLVSGVVLPLLP